MNRRKLSLGLLTFSLFGGAQTADAEAWFRYRTFRQRSRSMQPTIQPGDRVRVRLGGATLGATDAIGMVQIDRGDCVAFVAPVWSDAIVIFRVIGLPGETILTIDQQGVVIDGVPILREDAGAAPSDQVTPRITWTIPLLVLGKNMNTLDSFASPCPTACHF